MESILLKRTQEKIIKCKMMSFDFPKSLIVQFAIGRRKNNVIPEKDDSLTLVFERTFMLKIYYETAISTIVLRMQCLLLYERGIFFIN